MSRRDVLLLDPCRIQLLLGPVDRLDKGHRIDAGLDRRVQPAQPLLRLGNSLGRRHTTGGA